MLNRGRTKIVATVGPASRDVEMLRDLIQRGVDVFRLNMAHASIEEHQETLSRIRRVRAEVGRPVATLIDLAGPKIRLGNLLHDPMTYAAGEVLELVPGTTARAACELVTNYPPLLKELREGDVVVLADGTVGLRVLDAQPDRVTLKVTEGGSVRSRQGVNLPGVRLSVCVLTDADRKNAIWVAGQDVDFVSLSFVREPEDILMLKELLRQHRCTASVIAKIEKPEALEKLEEIVEASDGVMVARGDLGVEIDVADMPVAQKRIIATCTRLKRPVIVATQMLESMHTSRRPTRAEATDVANAILDGADACMLSGETAVGEFPRETVEMMNRIMVSTEELLRDGPYTSESPSLSAGVHPITDAVVFGSGRIAHRLNAKLVVIATRHGATALAKSKQRDYIRTVAICDQDATLRKMCLYWGIVPIPGAPLKVGRQLRAFVDSWGEASGMLTEGDRVVFVTDTGIETGAHDAMFIHEVGTGMESRPATPD